MNSISGAKEFVFTHGELERLERSVRKITAKALQVLGAEGPIMLRLEDVLEPVELASAKMQRVAEGDVIDMRDRFKGKRGTAKSQFSPEEEEERIALRQRYYGPEGEVTNIRPGAARKGLDKPFTQMSPSEFEEAGYVMKVPQEVLDDFELMVEETKRAGNLFEEARDWYHNIRRLLDQETPNDRDATLLGLLIATYSPRAKFALNLVEAAYMFKAVQKDAVDNPDLLREYLETFPGAEKRDPGARRGFTKAHKVPNFALNLIAPELAGVRGEAGEMSYDDMNMWNSTIDTWMIDAFYPLLKKASTQKEYDALKGKMMSDVTSYRYMTGLVAQEARKLNLLPHELQAIVWVAMKRRQSGADAATTEESIGQIKQAIENIRLISTDLDAVRQEMEDNSWLGILFKEIDEKGFAEAAKFTLGIKDEKGKTAVSGVRSITSKGKKGDQFKYFPPEPPRPKEPKSKSKGAPKPSRPKPEKRFEDPKYSELATFYVMNEVIQMPTGKFNNLYDSVSLYLDPKFSVDKAIEYITGRWDPEARASSKYFKEQLVRKVMQKLGVL